MVTYMIYHIDERPYPCQHCQKAFKISRGKTIQLQKVWQMQTRVIQNALEIPGEYL